MTSSENHKCDAKFNDTEKYMLLNVVEKKNNLRDGIMSKTKKCAWERIIVPFNSSCTGYLWGSRLLRNCYENLKKH